MNLQRLRESLLQHEGIKLFPYQDSEGYITIGVGRNLQNNGITPNEAMAMLRHDTDKAVHYARKYVWFEFLNDARQNVIVEMIFNLGPNRFAEFRNMIAALSKHDYAKASAEMLNSKWRTQVKSRALRLADQMKTGEFTKLS